MKKQIKPKESEFEGVNVIPVLPIVVMMCKGNVRDALLLHQLMYWGAKRGQGMWFYESNTDLYWQTGLTRNQTDKAVASLVKRGYIETTNMVAEGHNTRHFNMRWEKIAEDLISLHRSKECTAANAGMKWGSLLRMTEWFPSNAGTILSLYLSPSLHSPASLDYGNQDSHIQEDGEEKEPLVVVDTNEEIPAEEKPIPDTTGKEASLPAETDDDQNDYPEKAEDPATNIVPPPGDPVQNTFPRRGAYVYLSDIQGEMHKLRGTSEQKMKKLQELFPDVHPTRIAAAMELG